MQLPGYAMRFSVLLQLEIEAAQLQLSFEP